MELSSQNKYVGDKIRSYRKRKNFTQTDLAKAIGVKNNTVSAYERGVIEIPHSKLLEVAKALEIKYTALLPIEKDSSFAKESIQDYVVEAEKKLTTDQFNFFEQLLDKALSLNEVERDDFFKNVRFAIKFFDEDKK
ncbi:MAG: helix-turn-helix domain-containing protein [Planococcaceae bacterium]|nr:helix-turn-helix domain-containing protein [Planococcaceae bacterium]